jgi:hypothetical protein
MIRNLSLVLLTSSLSLVACGGGTKTTADAKVIATVDGGADAATGTPDAPAAACTVSTATFGDKGALTGSAFFTANAAGVADDVLEFDGPLESASPSDIVSIQLYAGVGVFANGIVPGTYPLTGDELNYQTCANCVLVYTNVDATNTAGDGVYMATGGTVTITATGTKVGDTLTGTITGLTFEHVTIDANFLSTPVGDSCTTALTNATFTGTLAAPPA